MMDELDRLVLAAADDGAAFDRLVELCQDGVRLFVAAHASNEDQIEEVCQVAWVAVYEHLGDYRGGGSFPSWVKGFARNFLLKDQERRRRERTRHATAIEYLDDLLAVVPDEADERVASGDLRRCLERLTPAARKLIEARHVDGVSLSLLAQRFRRAVPALATSLWRIRAELRRCLESSL